MLFKTKSQSRVNIDYRKKNKKRNCTSLWDQSKMSMCKESKAKRMSYTNEDESDKLNEEFPTEDDGAIFLSAGDLVILAYDDA